MATVHRVDRAQSVSRVSPELLDRMPPHSLEAEKGVLGSLLIDPEMCDEVALILHADDFYADANARLYKHMMAMHESGGRIDTMLLRERLKQEGDNYVTFSNSQPGRGCQALQGFAVDGRKVSALRMSLQAKGKDIRPGQNVRQLPTIIVTFFDEKRATVGRHGVGSWRGSFEWQKEDEAVPVPLRAREAIVTIGLLGAVGELSFDDINMEAVKR